MITAVQIKDQMPFTGLEQIILDVIFGHACGQEEEYPLLLRF